MEFTNKLVEKYGTDKLLHFLVGAWLMAEAKVSHNMFIIKKNIWMNHLMGKI